MRENKIEEKKLLVEKRKLSKDKEKSICGLYEILHKGKNLAKEKNIQLLKQKILIKDEKAIQIAKKLGMVAESILEPLLQNPDAEIRELVIRCVAAIDSPTNNALLLKALEDGDINVRSIACHLVEQNADIKILPALLEQCGTNEDEYIRGELALIIGRLDDKFAVLYLRKHMSLETDFNARTKILMALARLHDQEARNQIRSDLKSLDAHIRFEAIQKYEYLNDPNTLIDLQPLLADKIGVLNINPFHAPPSYLRLCDIVTHIVTKVGKPKFTFDGTERRCFLPNELNEVSEWLDTKRKQLSKTKN